MTEDRDPFGRFGATLLLVTVFASGASVMIVEMTAVRAVQPFFGSTTYVWTNVIAVVLGALALGYAIGGRLADRWPSPKLLYGLLGGGGLLTALGAVFATAVSRLFLQDGVDLEGIVSVLLWGSLGATLVLFAPPILLLGTICPMAIRLLARRGVGRAAGSVFALSTVGSIVGTYLPTLVLVPHLGSRGTLLVAAGILLVVSAAGWLAFARRRAAPAAASWLVLAVVAIGLASWGVVRPDRPPPLFEEAKAHVLEEVESSYQYLTVRDDAWPEGTERVLTINEGLYSFHALERRGRVLTGSRYYDAYAVLPFLLDLEAGDPLDACIVGLACGVNARQWHHFHGEVYDLHVDGAEIDPEILRLGREHFHLPLADASWLDVYALDGRSLLALAPDARRYHVIVVDAFANELYVPFHLATREFFCLCRRRLREGGLLAMNVYARGADASNLTAIEQTLAAVFGEVLRIPHYEDGGFLLLARRGAKRIDLDALLPHALAPRRGAEPAEWAELVDLADTLRTTAASRGRWIRAHADARVLTDDHAPLAWLTDRFLAKTEAALADAGDGRSRALAALRARQTRLLLAIGVGWAGARALLVRLGAR